VQQDQLWPLRKSRYNPSPTFENRPSSRFILSSSIPTLSHNQAQQHLSPHRGYQSLSLENAIESKHFAKAPNVCFISNLCSYTPKKHVDAILIIDLIIFKNKREETL